jgi:hypothetical protein
MSLTGPSIFYEFIAEHHITELRRIPTASFDGRAAGAGGRPRRRRLKFTVGGACEEKSMDKTAFLVVNAKFAHKTMWVPMRGGDLLGSVIKKRRKKMRKHKHKKLLAKTRHQRRSR